MLTKSTEVLLEQPEVDNEGNKTETYKEVENDGKQAIEKFTGPSSVNLNVDNQVPSQELESLQFQMKQMQTMLAQLNLKVQSSPQHACSQTKIILKSFFSSPMSVHKMVNPKQYVLAEDGSNYNLWEAVVDRTLSVVFQRSPSFLSNLDNFDSLSPCEDSCVSILLRSTLDGPLYDSIEVYQEKNSCSLYESIRARCRPSDREQKLNAIDHLILLLKDKRLPRAEWIRDWCHYHGDLAKLKVETKELMDMLMEEALRIRTPAA